MRQIIKRHSKVTAALLIIIIIFVGLISYQKSAAQSYLAGQGCTTGTSQSAGCSNTCITYSRALLGLVVEYKYQPFSCPNQVTYNNTCSPADTYSGKVISIPGKHFIFDTKSQAYQGACAY